MSTPVAAMALESTSAEMVDALPNNTQPTVSHVDKAKLSRLLKVPLQALDALSAAEDSFAAVFTKVLQNEEAATEMRSGMRRLEVQLEQTEQTWSQRKAEVDSSLEQSQLATQDLTRRLRETEDSKRVSENELLQLKRSRSTADDKVDSLSIQLSAVERDKQDYFEALARKTTDLDRLKEEQNSQQESMFEYRRRLAKAEAELNKAQSSETSAKFQVRNAQDEIDRLNRNNSFLDAELQHKSDDLSKLRNLKNGRISALEADLDEAKSKAESLDQSSNMLKQHLAEMTRKAEDDMLQIKELKDQRTMREEAFIAEESTRNRLLEVYKKSYEDARQRIIFLEKAFEDNKEKENLSHGNLEAMIETEREEKEAAEQRVAELESEVEKLNTEAQGVYDGRVPLHPGTPLNGSMSPAPSGSFPMSASGVNITQLSNELYKTKRRLDAEERRNQTLQTELVDIVNDLDAKAPIIEELRDEAARMQAKNDKLASMCGKLRKQRDEAVSSGAESFSAQSRAEKELANVRRTAGDMARQIQFLLSELQHLSAGNPPLSDGDMWQFVRTAEGQQFNAFDPNSGSDVDRLLATRLLYFKNIQELQQQNSQLRELTRQLSQNHDDAVQHVEEEVQRRVKVLEDQVGAEMTEAQKKIDELNALVEGVTRERNMFQRMASKGINATPDASGHMRQSLAGDDTLVEPGALVELTSLREELQHARSVLDHFRAKEDRQDQLSAEMSRSTENLLTEVRSLQESKADLTIKLARAESHTAMVNERLQLQKSNFELVQKENQYLSARVAAITDNQAKSDAKAEAVSENLTLAHERLQSIMAENSNLKAEKSFFESTEIRIKQQNEDLIKERDSYRQSSEDIKILRSEAELREIEAKRSLASDNESLRSQLSQAKSKIEEDVEDFRKSLSRKETDLKNLQTRLEDAAKSLAATRESLIAANTSKDHLQSQVNDLTSMLRDGDARSSRSRVVQNGAASDPDSMDEDHDDQIKDLSMRLDQAKALLESSFEETQRYIELSAAFEKQVQSLTVASDAYRDDMEKQISDLEAEKDGLRANLEASIAELSQARLDLIEKDSADTEKTKELGSKVETLNSEVSELKVILEKSTKAFEFAQADLKEQAQIAKGAQENWEQEFEKHAKTMSKLKELRDQSSDRRSEISQLRAEAESARVTLAQGKESWEVQKSSLEKELEGVRQSHNDLRESNRRLLDDWQNLSKQIEDMQSNRFSEISATATGNDDVKQAIISQLRRDKEITEASAAVLTQDNARLRKEIEYSQSKTAEAEQNLRLEQTRAIEQLRGASRQQELKEKISELNILRDSNNHLRGENERLAGKVNASQERIANFEKDMQPLKEQLSNLEAETAAKEDEIKLLRDDNTKWRERHGQAISKFNTVDPVEVEKTKANISTLETQIQTLTAELETARASETQQLSDKDKEIERFKARADGIRDKANSKIKELSQSTKDAVEKSEGLAKQADETRRMIGQLTQEKEQLLANVNALTTSLSEAQAAAAAQAVPEVSSAPDPVAVEAEIQSRLEAAKSSLQAEFEQRVASTKKEILDQATIQKQNNNKIFNEAKKALQDGFHSKTAELAELRTALENEYSQKVVALQQNGQSVDGDALRAMIRKEIEDDHFAQQEQFAAGTHPDTDAEKPRLYMRSQIQKMVEKNVQNRLGTRETALATRERAVQEKELALETRQTSENVSSENFAELEARLKAKDEEIARIASEKDEAVKQARDKAAQEAEMRSKVKISMLERKLAVSEAKATGTPQRPAVGSPQPPQAQLVPESNDAGRPAQQALGLINTQQSGSVPAGETPSPTPTAAGRGNLRGTNIRGSASRGRGGGRSGSQVGMQQGQQPGQSGSGLPQLSRGGAQGQAGRGRGSQIPQPGQARLSMQGQQPQMMQGPGIAQAQSGLPRPQFGQTGQPAPGLFGGFGQSVPGAFGAANMNPGANVFRPQQQQAHVNPFAQSAPQPANPFAVASGQPQQQQLPPQQQQQQQQGMKRPLEEGEVQEEKRNRFL